MLAAIIIFLGTYLVLAIGRLPGFHVDRTGAAIIGASLMIGLNILTLEEAFRAINYETLLLLFGMMIVVANLRLSGFFNLISNWAVLHTHRPLPLLCAIVFVSGLFSAFFINDTMCLVLTPLVLEITRRLKRNPVPYLLAIAMSSNIGSVATITGNPQNMLIGTFSQIPYWLFSARLAPVAAVGLILTILMILLFYRHEFLNQPSVEIEYRRVRINKILMAKSLGVSIVMVGLFFMSWPVAKVAFIAGALLLVTRRVKPEKIYREIDWSLLVLFAGLFIILAGAEKTYLAEELAGLASRFQLERVDRLSFFTLIISNLFSNVPAVLVFKPFVAHLPDQYKAWLVLAMASTLAGNLTLLGSMANLIVVEKARPAVKITFGEYLRVGIPLTILSLLVGVLWLR
jgi:Na+/H+ antiporter NhaD/arsenite permease-like protein